MPKSKALPAKAAPPSDKPSPPKLITLPSFLATEGANLDAGLVQHRDAVLARFEVLNGLFYEPHRHIKLKREGRALLLGALFDMAHFQLHFTMATFLRGHRSEAFASVRKAIDAAMNAMVLHIEPTQFTNYKASAYPFTRMTHYLTRPARQAAYPLATHLVDIHGICSNFASHADFRSLPPRAKLVAPDGGDWAAFRFFWFEPHQEDPPLDHAIGIDLLVAFGLVLRAFMPWIFAHAPKLAKEWRKNAMAFVKSLNAEQDAIAKEFKAAGRLVKT